jgi:large-conductance mechanosensitive channel
MPRRYASIVQWLDETNLIAGAVATLIAISAHAFLSTFVQSFILDPLDTHTREVRDLKFTAGRYTVVYGVVLEKFVHLLVVCVVCFAVIVYAQRYLGWT